LDKPEACAVLIYSKYLFWREGALPLVEYEHFLQAEQSHYLDLSAVLEVLTESYSITSPPVF
jgi:hypothetical protein